MLRDIKSLTGFKIHATDGELGTVEEFYFDDRTWDIRYMVVKTGGWLSGRKVLISPGWIENVDWETAEVFVYLSKEEVKDSPVYDPSGPLSPDYINNLHDHYGRPAGEAAGRAGAAARGRKG